MNRRVLIVTSSYRPTMIADMHRARHLAWELPKLDWDVEILAPDTSYQIECYVDRDSTEFFASDTPVHFVKKVWARLFEMCGLRSIGWRALVPIFLHGRRLLRERRFDLVYFSTTHFPLFLLGPLWRRKCGVPYVLDFHDPYYKEELLRPVWARPSPKHTLVRWLAKYGEAFTASRAAGLVSVSPQYLEMLHRRYEKKAPDWLGPGRRAVIPFAVLRRDFDETVRRIDRPNGGQGRPFRIVYVGVGGVIMRRSFELLCRSLAFLRKRHPELVDEVRIELYGTMLGWRDGEPRYLADVAAGLGVGDMVMEDPRRVSYRRSLELLLESDGVLVLGVDDAGYMPSKLFSYALSGKPLLASLRRESPAFAQFQDAPGIGHAIWIEQSSEMPLEDSTSVVWTFLQEVTMRRVIDRGAVMGDWLAPAMARLHAELFSACLQAEPGRAVS